MNMCKNAAVAYRALMTRGPQTHKFYKKLVEDIFPSRSGLRCYELYTLYLGVLSVKSITHYDRNLVAILLDRKNK